MDSFGQDWSQLPGLFGNGFAERWRVAARGLEWSHFFASGYLFGVFIQGAFVGFSIPSGHENEWNHVSWNVRKGCPKHVG